MRTALGFALVLALLGSACGNDTATPVAPTTTTTPPCPCTETFASAVAPSGTTSHSFVATQAGSVAITLASSGPPTNVTLGVGIGIPTLSSTTPGCNLSTAINTAPGSTPQLTVPVDAGAFCVKVFDPGGPPLGAQAFFSLTISRP